MALFTSRLLLVLAALAAGVALSVAPDLAGWLATMAVAALAGAMLLRRSRGQPSEAGSSFPADLGAPSTATGQTVYLDLLHQVIHCTASAETLDEALRTVVATLGHGLGAGAVAAWRVVGTGADAAELRRLTDAGEAELPDPVTVLSHESGCGLAVTQQRAVVTPRSSATGRCGVAVPVSHDGCAIAVIELRAVACRTDDAELHSLLDSVRLQLGLVAERHALGVDRDPSNEIAAGDPALDEAAMSTRLPVSLFVFDVANWRIVGVNAHAEREFGLQRSELLGRTIRETVARDSAPAAEAAMAQALVRDDVVEAEYGVDLPVGHRVVSARFVALRDAQGRPIKVMALARDITMQRRAEHDLLEAQARFREFADAVDEGLFVANPDRTHYEFLTTVKYEGQRISRSNFDADPAALDAHVEPADLPLRQARRESELRLEPTDISYRVNHPRLGQRWMRSRTRSRRLADGQVRVYGLVSDVTADRAHEEEVQHARQAAELASQAKSQFMASMSHEIRTPMNGILGMTELLLGTSLSDKQRRFVQAVYRSGESLLEIINDILDFSKIEAGKLELAGIDFVLRGVVEDTLELLAPRAHEKGLELSFREEPGLPFVVNGDPLRLRQVLTNLVANAIKFTEQGEVVVSLCVPPGALPGELSFGVHDTGIGIEADAMPRLFDAFSQGSEGMSRRYGGTGLGLTISKQLVELMGGRIEVRSQPGVGSHFTFSVPFQPADTKSDADGTALGFDLLTMPHMRVLVVEDNETNRIVLDNMLEAWGMEVVLAEDGRQALDILQGRTAIDPNFDLALVDMQMPRLDGVGLALALKATGHDPRLKMILLSSASSPDDVRSAHQAGFDRFVPKPIRKAELRQAILGISASIDEGERLTPQLNAHILVVEDNVVNQEVIGQMLRTLGCRVQVSSGALAGLRAMCEKPFDLVLMDIQMPGMDGVEALNWFRRGTAGRFNFLTSADTPIIAVTANALGGDEERFLGLGFDDYLSKPFRQSQLLAMLTKHLRLAAPAETGTSGASGLAAAPASGSGAVADPAHDTGVLDPEALERLRELDPSGENRLMERVVNAFETSLGRLLPQLQEAVASDELGGIRHVAHTLKSSSASIGAMKLSRICADVESRARTEQIEGLPDRVAQLQAEVEVVRVALKRILST